MEENKKINAAFLVAALIIIAAVTAYPYLHPGLYGYAPDYIYHMNRIEGVKDAILAGNYPVYVYSGFFEGEGYGSPMFYPDLFLVIPAILRIIGISALKTYKLVVVLVCILASLSTYFSLKYVTGNRRTSLAGTFLFMLSQFVLADIIFRAGYSSYMSYIFLPILFAGIYDFFMKDAKRTYLIGVALGGLVLCHIINAFIALLLTAAIFVVMLVTKKGREAFFNKEHLLSLAKAAGLTFLVTAYYTIPMIEQMSSGVERVYQDPWAHIGEFVQPFEAFFLPTGYFFNIAYVGVGIPILLIMGMGIFVPGKKDGFGIFYYVLGILLLLSMTSVVPWEKLENTVLNQLQFTFRIYPFALCTLIFGIVITASQALDEKKAWAFLIYAVISTSVFGVMQNNTALAEINGYFNEVNEEILAENSSTVGRGEWLPVGYDTVEPPAQLVKVAEDMGITYPYERKDKKVGGSFEAEGDGYDGYVVPQIYYKGYKAVLNTSDGRKVKLSCSVFRNGRTLVSIPAEEITTSGTVTVSYGGTVLQKLSLIVTLLSIVGMATGYLLHKKNKA